MYKVEIYILFHQIYSGNLTIAFLLFLFLAIQSTFFLSTPEIYQGIKFALGIKLLNWN